MASNKMELVPSLREQLENEGGDLLAEMLRAKPLVATEVDAFAVLAMGSAAPSG